MEPSTAGPENINNSVSIATFLNTYGVELAEKVMNNIQPIHNPLKPVNVDSFTKKIQELKRSPYPSQGEVIKALAKGLYSENLPAMLLNGEMGTGKTLIGAAVCYLSPKPIRSLIMCPPHLVGKWQREIKITVPDAKVINLNGRDCIKKLIALRDNRNTKPKGYEFYVFSRERAKGGYMWKGAFNPSVLVNEAVKCPRCGGLLMDEGEDKEINYLTPKKLNSKKIKCRNITRYRIYQENVEGKKVVVHRSVTKAWIKINKERIDNEGLEVEDIFCNDNLWCADNKKLRRTSPADFISKYLQGFFQLGIFDEVHELKSGNSNQGIAFGSIGSAVDKILCLTGTLLGGYADDIFYILFRIAPDLMKSLGFNYGESMKFIREYGILEEVIYINDADSNRTGRGKKGNKLVKRKPGVAPTLSPLFLLDKSVFIKLADVAEGLPAYDEYVLSIEMSPEQQHEYMLLENGFKQLIQAIKRSEHQVPLGIISQMIQSLLSYPDSCIEKEENITRKKGDCLVNLLYAPKIDTLKLTPKEAELLSIIKEEVKNNRNVLVYASFTGTRDITPRIKRVLENEGITTAILRSSVATDKREKWINDKVRDEGVNVLICNPELVKTGLDLLDFPTIVFFQTGYRLDTLRQASRRSWRIGQTQPVKIFFLTYSSTMQSAALSLMAQKLDTALTVEGDLSDKGLAAMSEATDSLISDLVKGLLSGKQGKGVSAEEAWASFRKKEISNDLALDTRKPESKTSIKSEIVELKVDKAKKVIETKEEFKNKILKVTIIEQNKPRKKRTSHLEVTEQSLDELLKDKKKAIVQYCLF